MAKLWTPREHQILGSSYLFEHQRANLWAHPGLGKTSLCYRLFDLLKLCGSAFFPILVIAPLAVARDVWPDEQRKWADFEGMRVVPIIGSVQQRTAALMLRADVYTVNYENLVWLVEYFGERWPFRFIVADESTRLRGFRLKGQGTSRATALGKIANRTGRWVNLTGTPSPHGLESIWGQQWFVDFGERLGHGYTDYIRRWFIVDPYTREVAPRPNARQEIYAALADCTMALRAEDWLDVKKPHEFEKRVILPPDAMKHYRTMERQFFADLPAEKIVAWNAAAKSGKLIQLAAGSIYDANAVAHHVHDAKIDALRSLFDELDEPLLVVYHFKFDAAAILKEFGSEARVYAGKSDEEAWNAGKIPMLLIHPKSAGHGLSLQHGGRAICFFTNTWDLELRLQAIERLGPARQLLSGYDRAVLIYDLIAENTVDVNVLDRLEGRATEQEALMAARARAMN
ncbi:MAG: ATP-dependent helicase [Patescibacteria group bacterium]|nr:ATP-dependent helicase [Patescibacteria group bacterium]